VGRILIVDDDADLAEMLSEYLKSDGFETETAASGAEGAERAIRGDCSLAVLDAP